MYSVPANIMTILYPFNYVCHDSLELPPSAKYLSLTHCGQYITTDIVHEIKKKHRNDHLHYHRSYHVRYVDRVEKGRSWKHCSYRCHYG